MQNNIDKLRKAIAGHGTVVASALQLISGFVASVRAARDDPAELDQLTADIESQSAQLSAAVVTDTPASDEALPADGGTGTDDTAVVVEDVEIVDVVPASDSSATETDGQTA